MQDSVWEKKIHEPFIAAALAIALTAGFGYAALLSAVLSLKIPLGTWWGAVVQAHGHAQLFGWMGMFILGMGLYFLPKLRGTRLRATRFAAPGFWLLTVGIVLRSLAQPALLLSGAALTWTNTLRGLMAASGVAELAGMLFLASMLVSTVRAAGPLPRGAPAHPVLPFLVIAAVSTGLAFVANTLGVLSAAYGFCANSTADASTGSIIGFCPLVPPTWDLPVIRLMLYGLALPIAFVFSVRNLPLYLRIASPPRDPFRYIAGFYALGLALRLAPDLAAIFNLDAEWLDQIGALGILIQGAATLIFIWLIDLMRLRAPWTVDRMVPPTTPFVPGKPGVPPTREKYPDAGEFGRFELLIYSAYFWLVVAVMLGVVRALGILFGHPGLVPLDAERHALTVGFITLLIFGMAARMAPGFSHKRRVASAPLVLVTLLLGNAAVILRVVPLFLPTSAISAALFGISGAIDWLAVAALAVNLGRTIRLKK